MEATLTKDEALAAAAKAGFDLDMIDTNLSLTVEARWRQHDEALNMLLKFQRARIERDARLSRTS
jgi:hypothetical protein